MTCPGQRIVHGHCILAPFLVTRRPLPVMWHTGLLLFSLKLLRVFTLNCLLKAVVSFNILSDHRRICLFYGVHRVSRAVNRLNEEAQKGRLA